MLFKTSALLFAAAALSALPAHAIPAPGSTVLGDVVSGAFGVTGQTPFLDMTSTAIDPGAEFIYGDRVWADLSDEHLVIRFDFEGYTGESALTEWTIGDLDFAPVARLSAFALVSGPEKLVVGTSFTDDSLTASFADLFAAGYDGETTFAFAFATTPSAVPLPAALPLAGAGLAALGLVARRRRARSA